MNESINQYIVFYCGVQLEYGVPAHGSKITLIFTQDASEVLPKLVLVLPELGGRVFYILL